jgi:hypothetical protein
MLKGLLTARCRTDPVVEKVTKRVAKLTLASA